MRVKLTLVFLLFLGFFCLPFQKVAADTGPKPTMDFTLTQAFPGPQVSLVTGTLFQCDQPDCSDAAPLRELGPQRLRCEAFHCSALAYGFSQYSRLEFQFSDGKTRQSNVFEKTGFNSSYQVTVRAADLLVEPRLSLETISPWLYLLGCCGCLLALALVVGVVILLLLRRKSSWA